MLGRGRLLDGSRGGLLRGVLDREVVEGGCLGGVVR